MKRSEKVGMILGLVVGLLMLLISVLVSLWPACIVQGAQKSTVREERAGSWRSKDGNLRKDLQADISL